MIPILYSGSETAFTSNGIGRLTDCIKCTVTEEKNGIYENVAMNGSKFGAKSACTRADFVTFVYNYNLDAQIVK